MLAVVFASLIFCAIVGAISSVLLVAVLHFYRKSQQNTASAAAATTMAAAATSATVEAGDLHTASGCRIETEAETKASRSNCYPHQQQLTAGDGSTGTSNCSSCCNCQKQQQLPVKPQYCQSSLFNSCSDTAAAASVSSYNCQVCGSCCAEKKLLPGKQSSQQLSTDANLLGKNFNVNTNADDLLVDTDTNAEVGNADCELCIGDSAISFRCFASSHANEATAAAAAAHNVGVYFFHRAKTAPQPVLLTSSASSASLASGHQLTVPAVTGTPYNLWFCPAGVERHYNSLLLTSVDAESSSRRKGQHSQRQSHRHQQKDGDGQLRRRCSDCRRVLCFELTGDGEVLFHRRRQRRAGHRQQQLESVWLLAALMDESGDNSGGGGFSIVYRGEMRRLPSLTCQTGRLLVLRFHFSCGNQLCPQSAVAVTRYQLDRDEQSIQSAQGDLMLPQASAKRQRMQKQQPQQQQQWRYSGDNGSDCDAGDENDGNDDDSDSDDSSSSLSNSMKTGEARTQTQSPMSLGSTMRKAVRWPITQIESLMESSSSSSSSTSSSSISASAADGGGNDEILAAEEAAAAASEADRARRRMAVEAAEQLQQYQARLSTMSALLTHELDGGPIESSTAPVRYSGVNVGPVETNRLTAEIHTSYSSSLELHGDIHGGNSKAPPTVAEFDRLRLHKTTSAAAATNSIEAAAAATAVTAATAANDSNMETAPEAYAPDSSASCGSTNPESAV